MKKLLIAPMFASLVLISLALMACEDDDVGLPCSIAGAEAGTASGTYLSADSYDCRSRLCLQWEGTESAQCTQVCQSNEDCPEGGPSCPNGEPYVCVVAGAIGDLACCKLCVCRESLSAEERSGVVPSACQNKTPSCPEL